MLKVLAGLEVSHFVRHFDCFFDSLCRSRFLFDTQVKMKVILHANVSLKKEKEAGEVGVRERQKLLLLWPLLEPHCLLFIIYVDKRRRNKHKKQHS